MRHHAFSLEVCVHDVKTAEYIRMKLADIREAIREQDLHVFRITETVHKEDESKDDEDEGFVGAVGSKVHMAS